MISVPNYGTYYSIPFEAHENVFKIRKVCRVWTSRLIDKRNLISLGT